MFMLQKYFDELTLNTGLRKYPEVQDSYSGSTRLLWINFLEYMTVLTEPPWWQNVAKKRKHFDCECTVHLLTSNVSLLSLCLIYVGGVFVT